MALLNILHYPDPRLHTRATEVDTFDDELARLVADMAETMYAAPGIGLAATQVDVHRRVVVMDISEGKDDLKVLVNPEITRQEGSTVYEEGCLSVPGIYEKVRRAEQVTVRARDVRGQPFELEAEGLLAICVQHEIDHLNGRVFVEHLSRLKQARIRDRLRKQSRETM